MEQVRGGVVAHRAGAALGVDDRADGLAGAESPVQLPAMDDQPAGGTQRLLDAEES